MLRNYQKTIILLVFSISMILPQIICARTTRIEDLKLFEKTTTIANESHTTVITEGSTPINKTSVAVANTPCSGTGTVAVAGSTSTFSVGYTYSFITNGDGTVTITFELLDTDKFGASNFVLLPSNLSMTKDSINSQKYSITIPNPGVGVTITYACKFQYASGGILITEDLSYKQGDACATVDTLSVGSPTVNPVTAAVCTGTSVTFTSGAAANATGTFTYQWQKDGSDISGATNSTYTKATTVADAGNYTVKIIGSHGSTLVSSSIALTVYPLSVGGTLSSSQTLCPGLIPTALTLTGSVGTVVRWDVAPAITFVGSVANNTSSTTLVLPTATIGNTYYRVRVQSGTCAYANSSSASIITTSTYGASWDIAPTGATSLVFNGNYPASTTNLSGCSCLVKTGKTVVIGTTATPATMTLTNELTVESGASLTFNNNSSLIQTTNVASNLNGGNIIYNRTTSAVKGYDYVYWSSPVSGQSVDNLHTSEGQKYSWNPTFPNSNGTKGNWVSAAGTMGVGTGYIVRASSSSSWAGTVNSVFTGIPNNGIIPPVAISRGALFPNEDDNWNLVGNPYPSAINATTFLTANNAIQGYVYLWSHASAPTLDAANSPFYASFTYNYNYNDYIQYDGTGSIPAGFNGKIAAGQGFFVVMTDGASAASGSVTFDNTMRVGGTFNSQFYKSSQVKTEESDEKSRIWLDLVDGNDQAAEALIGYVSGATLEKDRLFDADASIYDDENSIYSLIAADKMTIQGRSVPFDINDIVPLGVNIVNAGDYKIAINTVDGLFEKGQDIYLEDKLLNIIHDLRKSPYAFSSGVGTFDDRFVLRYTSEALANNSFNTENNNVEIAAHNGQIIIKSSIENMTSVVVYDVLGREIGNKKSMNTTEIIFNNIITVNQALMVKITLENGQIVTKKIIL